MSKFYNSVEIFSGDLKLEDLGSGGPEFEIKSTSANGTSGVMRFTKERSDNTAADNDVIGLLSFAGEDVGGNANTYGKIWVAAAETDAGNEAGVMRLQVSNDGVDRDGLKITGEVSTGEEVDVVIANGLGSTTTISGDLNVLGNFNGGVTVTDNSDNARYPIIFHDDSNNLLDDTDNFEYNPGKSTIYLESGLSEMAVIALKNFHNGATAPKIKFYGQRADDTSTVGQDGDDLGSLTFYGKNDAGGGSGTVEGVAFAKILAEIEDASDSDEAGKLSLLVACSNGSNISTTPYQQALIATGHGTNNTVDVGIGYGATSTTTIAGDLQVAGGDILGPTDGDLNIKSDGGIFLTLDTDNDESNQYFTIDDVAGSNNMVFDPGRGSLSIESTVTDYPAISFTNKTDDAAGSYFYFLKQRDNSGTQAGQDNDVIGGHLYKSCNDAGTPEVINYAYTQASIADASDTDEAGKYEIKVTTSDGSTSALQNALTATGSPSANDVDVLLARGTTSTTTIAGDAFVKADIQLGNALDTTLARSAAGKVTIAGNEIVTAGAVNVASGSQAPIGMQVARRTITQAEANAMNSTPIEIVPAQGANTMVIPVSGRMRVDRAATQTSSSADFNMHYEGLEPGTFFQTSLFHIRRFMWNELADREYNLTGPGGEVAQALTQSVNKAVEMSFDAATTTDCFTSIDVFLIYYVIDIS